MPPDVAPPNDGPRPRRPVRRPPSGYKPDLRPILILAGLLAAVVLGWIILSPVILPPTVR
jgi:hypothetical protein